MGDDALPSGESTQPSATPDTTPSAVETPSPAPAQPALSFGDALRQTAQPPAAQTPAPPAIDLDAERAKWETERPWAKELTADAWREHQEAFRAVREARENPVRSAEQLLAAALSNPAFAADVRSFVGRTLAGYRATAPQATAQPAPDPEPQPDLEANGKAWYSAEQMAKWREWNDRRIEAKFDQRFKPIEDWRTQTAEQQQRAEAERQQIDYAQRTYAEVSALPLFTENREAIAREFDKTTYRSDHEAALGLWRAYHAVVGGKFQQAQQSQAATDAARRAAANTGRPISSQPTQTAATAPLSFSERLAAEMAKQKQSA